MPQLNLMRQRQRQGFNLLQMPRKEQKKRLMRLMQKLRLMRLMQKLSLMRLKSKSGCQGCGRKAH
jgi:hypothetical protein